MIKIFEIICFIYFKLISDFAKMPKVLGLHTVLKAYGWGRAEGLTRRAKNVILKLLF